MQVARRFRGIVGIGLLLAIVAVAQAKYNGGRGEPNDPYQIATAADLIALGEDPNDYDKHFILTADIDLDPNLPGRKVFDRAVIAPDMNDSNWEFDGTSFTGVFDGDGHTISHLTIAGAGYLGLFGRLDAPASVSNIGLEGVEVRGSGDYVGGLVGYNEGSIAASYSTGTVGGTDWYVGGLVGLNDGSIVSSHSSGSVNGGDAVGGLVGWNDGSIVSSHSSGSVNGGDAVGGLVGRNPGSISTSYSSGSVSGTGESWSGGVGGLVGSNSGSITSSYNTGSVSGTERVGGLVGDNYGSIAASYNTGLVSGTEDVGGLVGACFSPGVTQGVWDTETAGLSESVGGVGLTTAEMMDPYMLGLNGFASDPNWVLDAGRGYPRLAWEGMPGAMIAEPNVDWLEGYGSRENPYRIQTAEQLIFLGRASALCESHFILDTDIDLNPNLPGRHVFEQAVIPAFRGVFDGRGHVISNLRIEGGSDLGLFGCLTSEAEVKNVGVVDVNITGSDGRVGALVGYNSDGRIATSYSTGLVSGDGSVGGLVGTNDGSITTSYSSSTVSGTAVYSPKGGLVGDNEDGNIAMSYSTGKISGHARYTGGLVGHFPWESPIGHTTSSFWDIQTSGQARSFGGAGKTTAEMQTAQTFLDAGWDFVGETVNGTEDIWWIFEGRDYPRLWWEQ